MISDNEILFYGLAILLFLLISAFLSAAETALTAISRARIYQLVMDGNKRAKIVSKIRREKESLIGTVLLGYNVVNIAASALATSIAINIFGNNETGLAIATLVMTILVVVFAEVLPKTYAIQNPERASLIVAPTVSLLIKLLYPITFSVQVFIRVLLRLFGVDITKTNTLISATDILRGTIELHHREGQMIKQDRDMLGSILDLNDVEIKDIMIHRKSVETIDADLPAPELIKQAVSTMHSRIPLWRGEPDNIIGLLHVKDLVKALNDRLGTLTRDDIIAICHKPWFVPETTDLRSQLIAFRNRRLHMAFVVDEYGAWQGIITLEDIIEEIVGDIGDEHDEAVTSIQKLNDRTYIMSGGVTVRDVNRQLDWSLPDEEASTVAGLLINAAETIPSVGERYNLHGFRFTVEEKIDNQVTRLKIEKLRHAEAAKDHG